MALTASVIKSCNSEAKPQKKSKVASQSTGSLKRTRRLPTKPERLILIFQIPYIHTPTLSNIYAAPPSSRLCLGQPCMNFRLDPIPSHKVSTPLSLHPFSSPPSPSPQSHDKYYSRRISLKSGPTRRQIRPMLRYLPLPLPRSQQRVFSRRFIDQIRHPCVPAWFDL